MKTINDNNSEFINIWTEVVPQWSFTITIGYTLVNDLDYVISRNLFEYD